MTPARSARTNVLVSPNAIQTASCMQRMRAFPPDPTAKATVDELLRNSPHVAPRTPLVLGIFVLVCLLSYSASLTTQLAATLTPTRNIAEPQGAKKPGSPKVHHTGPTLAHAITKR